MPRHAQTCLVGLLWRLGVGFALLAVMAAYRPSLTGAFIALLVSSFMAFSLPWTCRCKRPQNRSSLCTRTVPGSAFGLCELRAAVCRLGDASLSLRNAWYGALRANFFEHFLHIARVALPHFVGMGLGGHALASASPRRLLVLGL